MSHYLELTDDDAAPLDSWASLEAAIEAAARPPHPWVTISDEWGNLLRAEGLGEHLRLEARAVTAEGVQWWGLADHEGPRTQTTLHLPGRVVKLAPAERLALPAVKAAFKHVLDAGELPADMPRRPLSGDHGRLYMMVVGDDEPRPAMGWTDISRQLKAVPSSEAVVAALSEPGRALIGVFGNQDQITISVRESRDERSWERRVTRREGAGAPVELQLPQGILEVPARSVLSREDALVVLESIYRFDTPPPGFTWTLVE